MQLAWHLFCRDRGWRTTQYPLAPSVIQVRVKGAKGVLLVDPTLRGLRIVLRPSMIKFSAGDQYDQLEICKAFISPSRAFLNRPLIMVLEARGVPKETFLSLQKQVVDETQLATESMLPAAALLRSNGLGESLGLPTLLRQIASRFASFPEVDQYLLKEDAFMSRCLNFAVNHVLRGLKFRGHIPVPNSWTLVGVPDHHGILEEGQIFCATLAMSWSCKPLDTHLRGPHSRCRDQRTVLCFPRKAAARLRLASAEETTMRAMTVSFPEGLSPLQYLSRAMNTLS